MRCGIYPSEPALRRQIHRETPKPVPTFVVLSRDSGKPGVAMFRRSGAKDLHAPIARRQSRRDAFEHPGPTEIESVQVRQFRIARIGHDSGLQPAGANLREEMGEPRRVLVFRQDAAHQIRFGDAWRKEIFAGRLVGKRAVAIVQKNARLRSMTSCRSAGSSVESMINPNENAD